MHLRMLAVMALIFMGVGGAAAQDAETTWYFAQSLDGSVVAYTADGETRTLIEGGAGRPPVARAWRFGPQSVLALLESSDLFGLYHLTPETAAPITVDGLDAQMVSDGNWVLLGRSGPYAALVDFGANPGGPGLLVNLEAGTAAALTGQVYTIGGMILPFSRDGRLRYLSRENPEDAPKLWAIRERDAQTGEERVLHELDGEEFPLVTSDRYGDAWLVGAADGRTIYGADGSVTPRTNLPRGIFASVYVDQLMSYDMLCQQDCTFNWEALDGGAAQSYPLPGTGDFRRVSVRDRLSENELLVMVSGDLGQVFYIVSTEGASSMLGLWNPAQVMAQPVPGGALSPDGRYLLTLGTPLSETQYAVWDLQERRFALTGPLETDYNIISVIYGAGGFLVTEDFLRFTLFRADDETITPLPGEEERRRYFEVLEDGSVLFSAGGPAGGISRYDPVSENVTVLVDEATPINAVSTALFEYDWW